MRTALHIAVGFILGFVILGLALPHLDGGNPGAITNHDYALVEIAQYTASAIVPLRRGESKELGYGDYTITIPEIKATFTLRKNSRGTCAIHTANGILLVQTNENAGILP